jgi:hypothetical protein
MTNRVPSESRSSKVVTQESPPPLSTGAAFNELIPPGLELIFYNITCGAIAGVLAKTAVAPAERVKMSYQISGDRFTIAGALSRGAEMAHKQGMLSLWRGHSTTVLRVAPFAGFSYASHDFAERSFKAQLGVNSLPFIYKFTAGAIGGGFATLLTYPLDVLRVRLALVPDSTWRSTLNQGGLFQGLVPTMLGIVPYSGTSWAVKQYLFDKYKSYANTEARKDINNEGIYQGKTLSIDKLSPSLWESLFMNAIAGLSGQFVTYPLDIVRRRMQMEVKIEGVKPKGMWPTLRTLLETEGPRGLGKGFSLNIIKGPITMSISLTAYDTLRKYLFLSTGNDSNGGGGGGIG